VTADAPTRPERVPLRVTGLPRSTTTQFVLLVVSILAAGLFVGTAVHNSVAGAAWDAAYARCAAASAVQQGGPEQQWAALLACVQPAEAVRVGYALGAAALVAVGAVAVVIATPPLLIRRRKLRPLADRHADALTRMTALAWQARLRRLPEFMRGPSTLREPFCFGRPGRYRIAVPTKLLTRSDEPDVEPVIRHELAHIAHGDVVLSWLARGAWYALAPALMLPVIAAAVVGEIDALPSYLWRAVVVGGVVVIVQRRLLRAREHDADLAAAWAGGTVALLGVLSRIPSTPRGVLQRLAGHHPDPVLRIAVLDRPEKAVEPSFADGMVSAFLAALLLPVVNGLLVTIVLADVDLTAWVPVIDAALIGVLLGGTIGIAVWRQALVARAAGAALRTGPLGAGVLVGTIMGQVVSFAGTGLNGVAGYRDPWMVLVLAVLLASATALVAALGRVGADAAARFGPRTFWLVAVALATLVLGLATWAARLLQIALDLGGPELGVFVVQYALATPTVAAAGVLIGGAALWGMATGRRGFVAPAWLVPPGARLTRPPVPLTTGVVLAVGAVCGLVGVVVTVWFRALGLPADPAALEQWLFAVTLVAAGVGAAAAWSLALLHGEHGLGAGLAAVPVAALVSGLGFIALNTVRGGALLPGFVFGILTRDVAVALIVVLATAWLSLVPRPVATRSLRTATIAIGAALATVAAVGGIAGCAPAITPAGQARLEQSGGPAVTASADPLSLTTTAPPAERAFPADIEDYKERLAPALFVLRIDLNTLAGEIDDDRTLTLATKAQRLRTEILEPMRQLLAGARAYVPPGEPITSVHPVIVSSFEHGVAAYEAFVRAFERNSRDELNEGRRLLELEATERRAWIDAYQAM
jgi:Zn-dependent protease with chaperone function